MERRIRRTAAPAAAGSRYCFGNCSATRDPNVVNSLRLRELDAGRQTAEDAQTRTPTEFWRQLAHAERRPEALPYREGESFRHDSNHRRLRRSEPHDTTYHRRIRAESHLPESVPQNDDCGRLRRLVVVHENTPHQRGNAGHPKSSSADLGPVDGLAHLIAHGQVRLDRPERADVLEGSKSFPPVEDVVWTRRSSARLCPVLSSSARRCDRRPVAGATDRSHA